MDIFFDLVLRKITNLFVVQYSNFLIIYGLWGVALVASGVGFFSKVSEELLKFDRMNASFCPHRLYKMNCVYAQHVQRGANNQTPCSYYDYI